MNIPQLRFPEFQGEWVKKKLGEVAEKINSGKTPLGGESVYTERGILFIRSQNVNNDKLSFENATYIPEYINNTMNNSVVKANDILLNITGASLGRSCVVPTDFKIGNVNQHVCIIRLKKGSDPRFVQPILSSTKGQNVFVSLQTGSGREGLNFESIKGIEISFPTLSEQNKIATFLTAVDEKIQALKKKHSLLAQYKKGVMQRLFSSELGLEGLEDDKIKNEKNPTILQSKKSQFRQLRFKDENGNDFPKWEVKKLGEVGEIITGKTPSTADTDLWDGEIQFVTPTDINESKYQFQTQRTIKEISKTRLLPPKSIMFTCIASIGKMSLSVNPCVTNQQINSIIPSNHFDNEFVYYALLNIVDYIKSTQSTNTLPIINKTEFSKFEVNIPIDKKEQTAIANFLSALDEKINQTQQQIEKTETWKKGLLQKMFV